MLDFLKILRNHDNMTKNTEIETLIKLSDDSPLVSLILNNLQRLTEKTVKEIMVPRVRTDLIHIDSSREDILKAMDENNHTRYPVYGINTDDIKGILHVKDMLHNYKNWSKQNLTHLLLTPQYVNEETRIDTMFLAFQRSHSHMAIVQDEYNGFSGIVCLEDVIEEIVGEILDEHDGNEPPEFQKINDSKFIIDGVMNNNELENLIGISLPKDLGFESVGGFVMHLAETDPKVGNIFKYENITFEVKEMDGTNISALGITIH